MRCWRRSILMVSLLLGSAAARADEAANSTTNHAAGGATDNTIEITGQVVDAQEEPVAKAQVWFEPLPDGERTWSDAAGRFTIAVPRAWTGRSLIATADGNRIGFVAVPSGRQLCRSAAVRIKLCETQAFAVTALDVSANPVTRAKIAGLVQLEKIGGAEIPSAQSDADGKATLRVPVGSTLRAVCATFAEGRLGRLVEPKRDDSGAMLVLEPLGTAVGQITNPAGQPYGNRRLRALILIGDKDSGEVWGNLFPSEATADAEGKFQFGGLMVGATYRLLQQPDARGMFEALSTLKVASTEPVDLGQIVLERSSQRLTDEERVAKLLAGDPAEKYATARKNAAECRQYVSLWLVDRSAPITTELYGVLNSTRELRRSTDNYQLVFLDAGSKVAQKLARSLAIELAPEQQRPQIVVLDPGERRIAEALLPDIATGGKIDPTRMLDWLRGHAPEPLDAQTLLDDALADARRTNRRVLVQETATWCFPCHLISRFLAEQRAIWEKDFIWVRIDHRWTGSEKVIETIRTDDSQGIPWLAILDADGHVLATHLGFSATAEQRGEFLKRLKETGQHLTDDDLDKLRAALAAIEIKLP